MLDKIKANAKHIISVLLAVVVISSLVFYSFGPGQVLGATFTFTQSSWTGGATANGKTHPDNGLWNEYSAKDTNITAGASVSLTATAGSATHTTYADFSGGTLSSTIASSTANSVVLATTSPSVYASSGTYTSAAIDLGQASDLTTLSFSSSSVSVGGNEVPTMTSNTAPSPYVASADSNTADQAYYPQWKAFNHATGGYNHWITYATSGWLSFDFGSSNEKRIGSYGVRGPDNNYAYLSGAPKNWTFEGSNDNTNWTVLDTQTNITSWTASELKTFSIANLGSYRYYKLNISANCGYSSYTAVDELELYGGKYLMVDARTGNTATPDGTWTSWQTNISSGGSISGLTGNRYIQYRANLFTTDTSVTPSLDDITVNYNYYPASQTLTSSPYDSNSAANILSKIQWTEDYQQAVLNTSGLISYWKMDNDNWIDSKDSNNGTAAGGATFGTAKYGSNSGSFDGTDDYINIGNPDSLALTNNFTVEFWMKAAVSQNALWDPISHGHTANTGWVVQNSNTDYKLQLLFPPSFGALYSTAAMNVNVWHHIVIVRSSTSGLLLYVDGALNNSAPSNTSDITLTGYNFTIGKDPTNGRNYTGFLDEVAVYSTPLSASTIAEHYNSSSKPTGTDIKFQLRTSSNGSTWTDWLGPDGTNASYFTNASGTDAMPSAFSDGANDRYFQYKAFLTSNGRGTPTLSGVTVTYVVNAPPSFDATFGTNGVSVSQISSEVDANFGKAQIQYSIKDIDATTGTNTPGYITPSFEYSTNSG